MNEIKENEYINNLDETDEFDYNYEIDRFETTNNMNREMRLQKTEGTLNKTKPYVIYWNKIFIALAIVIITFLGIFSLIKFLANDTDKVEQTNKKLKLSTYGEKSKDKIKDKIAEKPINSKLKVVIDAGHGGHDSGCTDNAGTRLEKDDDLEMALAVKKNLESRGVEVIMTRETDVFISLDDRCEIANESGADLFISIHRNSTTVGNGVEIWVRNDMPEVDTALAENIINFVDEVGVSENRGVRSGYQGNYDANYQVNSQTDIPSCLVELGFMTYHEDNVLFDKYFNEYAEAISNAIIKTGNDLGID